MDNNWHKKASLSQKWEFVECELPPLMDGHGENVNSYVLKIIFFFLSAERNEYRSNNEILLVVKKLKSSITSC